MACYVRWAGVWGGVEDQVRGGRGHDSLDKTTWVCAVEGGVGLVGVLKGEEEVVVG